ncbi:hypothetical protein TRVA0_005S03862 [Trichomonascus vanleenenianus]
MSSSAFKGDQLIRQLPGYHNFLKSWVRDQRSNEALRGKR